MKSTSVVMAMNIVVIMFFLLGQDPVQGMSSEAKNKSRLKVLEMFKHAYNAYMKYAFPADELMPLSCKGRYRGSEPSRGDVDDSLGNFTLSLIDSLDTLAVVGEIEEFEKAVKLVVQTAKFDTDVIVSVFETNIRVVGGLLGGHVMAVYIKKKKFAMEWYKDELLNMAKDLGTRLLPAFNTTTGIPYPRINLQSGVNKFIQQNYKDTCTACAGTMVLEFAALSRFTGDPVFEEKAHRAMDFLWNQRHRSSDLVGTVINIHNGDWIRRDSGVGAGIDSYYEYVLKAYILLGDDSYLTRFNRHYEAVMKYVSQGPLFMDVHMHRPLTASKNFMDALLAFWPGLQVLKGDIPPAIEMHEMLYQVIQKHNFLPEAFTTDFHVHWGHHPLRPEFVESTYFLYKATGDPYYLEVGQKVIDNLEAHARVPCGYAAIKDVTKGTKEDQMDSFVLAETFKYLYLLFADKSDMMFDMDDYVFTTEGHLLPLSLSRCNTSRNAATRLSREMYTHLRELEEASHMEDEFGDSLHNTCPNPKIRYKQSVNYAHNLRTNLNIVPQTNKDPQRQDKQCVPNSHSARSNRLKASQFAAGNKEHLQQLKDMGINLVTMTDGRIQLLHTASEAISTQMAEEGFIFMQEMIDLSKTQPTDAQNEPMVVQLLSAPFQNEVFRAGPAQFGYDLKTRPAVKSQLEIAKPFKACSQIANAFQVKGKIALIERGDCMFVDKARNLQNAGAVAGICIDHTEGSSIDSQPLFAMSGDGTSDVSIPLVFLFKKEGDRLLEFLDQDPNLVVKMAHRLEVVGSVVEPSGPGQYTDKETGEKAKDQGSEPLASQRNFVFKDIVPLTPINENGEFEVPSFKAESSNNDVISFKELEDGSRQIFFRFDKIQNVKPGTAPDLTTVYQNVVKALLDNTNFSKLDKQSEYLTAIARLIESAYSSTRTVDERVQKTFEELTNELEVLSEEEMYEEQNSEDENDDVDETSADTLMSSSVEESETNVFNMEGVTVTVSTGSSKSERTGNQRRDDLLLDDHAPYADQSDIQVGHTRRSVEVTESELGSLYDTVHSKTLTLNLDASSIEEDEDFKLLEAINSDLAQKLKNGISKNAKREESLPKEQPHVAARIVKIDKSSGDSKVINRAGTVDSAITSDSNNEKTSGGEFTSDQTTAGSNKDSVQTETSQTTSESRRTKDDL